LSARNSASVIGVAASIRFFVSRTARRQIAGMIINITSADARAPRAKYMMLSMLIRHVSPAERQP